MRSIKSSFKKIFKKQYVKSSRSYWKKKQCINFFSTYFKLNIYTNMFYQFWYVTYLYSNVWPGSIGHCDIISAPFIHGVPRCNKPCQWTETVSISSALWTVIDTYWIAYKFLSWSFLFRKQSFQKIHIYTQISGSVFEGC